MENWLQIRPAQHCMFDCVSLGEVMLRLDPGESRIHTTRHFAVWEGGGEYNVTRGLRRCFGKRTAVVTALVDNAVGRLIEDCILCGGVDTQFIVWKEDDGTGHSVRNGLNFTERGFGIRGALSVPDRGNSAASQLKVGDIDWDHLFGDLGVRWFHTGGIFAALSGTTPNVVLEAVLAAKKHGTVVSYDLNYRPSLWKSHGGKRAAMETNRSIIEYVDVLLGNEEDFDAALGYAVEGTGDSYDTLDNFGYTTMAQKVLQDYPRVSCVATTLRKVKTACLNDWNALLCTRDAVVEAEPFIDLDILDRVGGGDSFASGLVNGFLDGFTVEKALQCGLVHGALAMTTPGDTSMATTEEVQRIMDGAGARVVR